METIRNFIDLLKRPALVRMQIIHHLFFARILYSFERAYNKFIASSGDSDENDELYFDSYYDSLEEDEDFELDDYDYGRNLQLYGGQSKRTSKLMRQSLVLKAEDRNQEAGSYDSNKDDELEWRRLVEVPYVLKLYGYLSNSYMIYVLVKNLLPVDQLIEFLFEPAIPGQCYLPGRLVLTAKTTKLAATLFSALHLCWRLVQYRSKPRMPTMLVFLLNSESELEQQYDRLDREQAQALQNIAAKSVQDLDSSAAGMPIQSSQDGHAKQDPVSKLFRHVLCYPLKFESTTIYQIRPNRTQEVRKVLVDHVARSSCAIVIVFTLIATPIVLAAVNSRLFDHGYASAYPNCDSVIEESIRSGHTQAYSITLSWHRIWSFPFEVLENAIIWVDSGVALMVVLPLAYLLNYDLLVHWGILQEKLESLLSRLMSDRLIRQAEANGQRGDNPQSVRVVRETLIQENIFAPVGSRRMSRQLVAPRRQPEIETYIRNLQAELSDFFHQLKEADTIVSDIISMGVVTWFATFCAAVYISVTSSKSDSLLEVRLCQYFGCLVFTISSFALLILYRQVNKSYKTLCSIMALDNSRSRLKFLIVMEYYTSLHQSTFTLFRQLPYRPTTFLTIIGWTFSSLFVVENLARQVVRA